MAAQGATATKAASKRGATTKGAASVATKGKSRVARAASTAKETIVKATSAAGKIVKGCTVTWNQRTRTGEKSYEGIVQSGVNDKGRRTVKITSSGETMQPMDKWLCLKNASPAK